MTESSVDVPLPEYDDEEEDDCYDVRMQAYRAAWMKCLDRVRVSDPMLPRVSSADRHFILDHP